MVEILREGDRAVGAVIESPQGQRRIRARRGVVLATGGIGWNKDLRKRLFPAEVAPFSQMPACISGDGITMAERDLGAPVDDGGDSGGLWMPCSTLQKDDGS